MQGNNNVMHQAAPCASAENFPTRHFGWVVLAFLLAVHAILAWRAVATKSITLDEIFHVTGGYFYDHFGDFRLHPDNGALPQRLHALPAVLMKARPPKLDDMGSWRIPDTARVCHDFFYEAGNDHWPLLMGARSINLLFSLGIVALAYGWARNLAGDLAGVTAAALAAFSPTLLAHGALATTDAAAALLLPASAGAFWWQLKRGGMWRLLVSSAVFGLACVSKYSAVLLLPVFATLASLAALFVEERRWAPAKFLSMFLVHLVAASVVIWGVFDFRYSAFSPRLPVGVAFQLDWQGGITRSGWQAPILVLLREWHLLPEAFIAGYANTYAGAFSRSAFLAGEYSTHGWRAFFPLAFVWKSAPAELTGVVLIALGVALHWRKLGQWSIRLAPLLVLGTIYALVAINSHLNIGHRHLLPVYTLLFVLTGVATAKLLDKALIRGLLSAVLSMAQLATCAGVYPDYLAYFNPLAGGPANGWRLLVDSSLDWGQDLPALKTWLDQHNPGPEPQTVFLSYFGSGEPDYYRIAATRVLFVGNFSRSLEWYTFSPGVYCVSATMLQHVYSPLRGMWTTANEREYEELRATAPMIRDYFLEPTKRAALLSLQPEAKWQQAGQRYHILEFARLCRYLRSRPPDDMAGYSILIYRLSQADLDDALRPH